ncbi:hypothetical protein PPERSA_05436 [Pseudocohnilembus persalinus]|uniref:Transmembrane protein n=1 Tax=Pseudocohnilembus persalinus TaxID=266149 RepID=A0A0V0R8T6_PSEPJ|nr:hypothetical protein PPERSA_05436 [Pseudocohnilembus persalinus]|eukprot:KRX10616.1 hypothetical protein PPERSA_05436 [Pseudocohnilembus persalinus]
MVKNEEFYDNHKKRQQTEDSTAYEQTDRSFSKQNKNQQGCNYIYPPVEQSEPNQKKKHSKNIVFQKKDRQKKYQLDDVEKQEQNKNQNQQQQLQQLQQQQMPAEENNQNQDMQESLPVRMIYHPNQVQIQLSDELFEFAQELVHYKKFCKCLFYTLIIFSLATVVNYALTVEDKGKTEFTLGEALAILDYIIWAIGAYIGSRGVELGRFKLVRNSNYLFAFSLIFFFGASIFRCWYYFGIKGETIGFLWGVFLMFFILYFFYSRAFNLIPKTYRLSKKMSKYNKDKSKQDPNISFLVQFEV